ncbi:Uncharacterised protein [uncultured archaeon]|nr:Uncharacterised protein [uncultured archaeon]
MHYNFIVYPEAIKKLKETKLDEKIEKALRNKKVSLIPGRIYDPADAIWMVDSLKENGFFKTIPFNFVQNFGEDVYQDWHQGLMKLLNKYINEQDSYWEIKKLGRTQWEQMSIEEDFPVISGYNASVVLDPEIFWQFKNFGFKSLSDFLGSVGAFARMKDKCYLDKGYRWQSHSGEQVSEFELGASEHGDFRLKKVDITPYKTFDPTGNLVSFRPETREEVQYVSASHSVESSLLTILLKWANQEKIPSEILKNYPDFISQVREQGQICGNFGDFGYGSLSPQMQFTYASGPLVKSSTLPNLRIVPHNLPCYGGDAGEYAIGIGQDRELVFVYQDKSGKLSNEEVSVPVNDFDNFFTGLFYQAQRGLGRTSVKNLTDIMDYYFSEEFKEDNK